MNSFQISFFWERKFCNNSTCTKIHNALQRCDISLQEETRKWRMNPSQRRHAKGTQKKILKVDDYLRENSWKEILAETLAVKKKTRKGDEEENQVT